MDIILHGRHNGTEIIENLDKVLKLFSDRYQIHQYFEIHMTLTLLDAQGEIVELVDNKSEQVYRQFEVYANELELAGQQGTPFLQLVVDNTK